MIVEDIVVLSIEEQKCEHVVNNDVERVVDFPASLYPYERWGCLPNTKQGTLVL